MKKKARGSHTLVSKVNARLIPRNGFVFAPSNRNHQLPHHLHPNDHGDAERLAKPTDGTVPSSVSAEFWFGDQPSDARQSEDFSAIPRSSAKPGPEASLLAGTLI